MWAAVSRGGTRFRSTGEVSTTGNFPVAAASQRGAVALFNVGLPPIDTIAYATLSPSGDGFTAAHDIPDHETVNSPVLAADRGGSFAAAWLDNDRAVNAPDSLQVTTGTSATLASPQAIPPTAGHQPEELAVGIDGRGEAIVLWDDFAGYSHGMFATFYRR
jgi:hypothetical protein